MPKKYKNLQGFYNSYKNMDKRAEISNAIDDFETYYQRLKEDNSGKENYIPQSHIQIQRLLNGLVNNYECMKNGELDEKEKKEFDSFLDTMQKDNSFFKKLMRTTVLDIYDTLKGDLDNKENADKLNKAVTLTEFYDRILNEKDKLDIRSQFHHGEAEAFLSKDKNIDGNFSKTLKELYRKYQNTADPEEKEKWSKVCHSYLVRPYMKIIENKVKQEDINKLPAEEQKKFRKEQQIRNLRKEAKTLGQNPDEFVNLSVDDRNKIRVTAGESNLATKRQNDIERLKSEVEAGKHHYKEAHKYFLNKPNRIDAKSAYLKRTDKDSQWFTDMMDSLENLRNTENYRQMSLLLPEGKEKTEDLIKNLDAAITATQNYITYANEKNIFQKGIMGTRRLKAANATMEELTGLRKAIDEEQKFMQDMKNKRVDLEILENAENGNDMKAAPTTEEVVNRMQITVKDLTGKDSDKDKKTNKILDDWVVVSKNKQEEKANNQKQANNENRPKKEGPVK